MPCTASVPPFKTQQYTILDWWIARCSIYCFVSRIPWANHWARSKYGQVLLCKFIARWLQGAFSIWFVAPAVLIRASRILRSRVRLWNKIGQKHKEDGATHGMPGALFQLSLHRGHKNPGANFGCDRTFRDAITKIELPPTKNGTAALLSLTAFVPSFKGQQNTILSKQRPQGAARISTACGATNQKECAMNLHNTWPYFDRAQWLAQGILETKQ